MRTLLCFAALGFLASFSGQALLSQTADPLHPAAAPRIPDTHTTALSGQSVDLPGALPGRATVLILGFGRHSADATTAWEKPIRTQLSKPPSIAFYDLAMMAEIPSFLRSVVLRSVRKQVPDVLKPNFLPLFDHEEEWKHAAGYSPDQPEAAYVLLLDSTGAVRWSTHESFSPASFARLEDLAKQLARN